MAIAPTGKILDGSADQIRAACERWQAQPVDQEMLAEADGFSAQQTTLGGTVSVTGPGTFFRRAQRTLTFAPSDRPGWWISREDLGDSLPIGVSVTNVWTTVRNIVLRSGVPSNYMRMVEHFVALRIGLGLDNVLVRTQSGDPPLFDRGSLDLVEAVDRAGIVDSAARAVWVTVKEPVTVGSPGGGFLTFLPAEKGQRGLRVDCAVDFPTAIGRQRIRFDLTAASFRHGALARTNTSLGMMIYCKTAGMVFADIRHMGYTQQNILVAGPRRYYNEPKLLHQGKSLEAAWHRAALDLLAAVALIDRGRFAGQILSYRAGHALDVNMVRQLYRRDLLTEV